MGCQHDELAIRIQPSEDPRRDPPRGIIVCANCGEDIPYSDQVHQRVLAHVRSGEGFAIAPPLGPLVEAATDERDREFRRATRPAMEAICEEVSAELPEGVIIRPN